MFEKLKALSVEREEVVSAMEAMISDEAFTEEQQAEFDALKDKVADIDSKMETLEAVRKARETMPSVTDVNEETIEEKAERTKGYDLGIIRVPARAKRYAGNLKAFKGENADIDAYKAGMFYRAIAGNHAAAQWCTDHGIQIYSVQNEGTNTQGGYLVYDQLDSSIIRLVEEWGVFRRQARRTPMTSETLSRPRRTGGITATFTGESDAATESTMTWDQVNLIAKKITAITRITNELSSDAIINVADEVTTEIAVAFAEKEDKCGFIGDGTSTYGGINGVTTKLLSINGVDDGGGLVLGAGNTMAEITLANMNTMTARTGNYPGMNEAWYCSKVFYGSVMMRLETAAGGNAVMDIVNGSPVRKHLGFPVYITNALPKTDANSQILCLFGDLSKSSMFGDRAGMSIAISDSAVVGSESVFENDELAVRGIERFDINNHDLGTSTAGGPVVGLVSAAS